MLGSSEAYAVLAVKNYDGAKKFYGETLGLKSLSDDPWGAMYQSGSSKVFVYPSEFAGTNQATAAGWMVGDLAAVVADLKSKGVSFEHYPDMPETKLEGDIHVMEGMKTVWFKDPDGNILNVSEMEDK